MNLTLDKLLSQQCQSLTAGESPLNLSEIEQLRQLTPSWQYCASENTLCQTFKFSSYRKAIGFVNQVADIAEHEDHHPELIVDYTLCKVNFVTHSVGGISVNDFICAAKIDQLEIDQ